MDTGYVCHISSKQQRKLDTMCTATECINPMHDHIDGDDSSERYGLPMLCTGCDQPAHWDEITQDYSHDSAETPNCFMIRSN